MNQRIQPFFRRGPAPLAFFAFYVSLSLVMLVSDLRWHTMESLRWTLATVIQPVQVVIQAPVRWASELANYLADMTQLREENENYRRYYLKSAAALVRMEHLEKENDRLRQLLALKTRDHVTGQITRILSIARDPLVRRATIDKGRRQGVKDGMPVIDTQGLIGQVTRVTELVSEITLITDKNQSVPVKVSRNGLRAVLYGLGNGTMKLPYLPTNTDVQLDDILVTSGLDGTYLPGLPVGRITQIERDPSFGYAEIVCTPLSNVENNDEVLILQVLNPNGLLEDKAPTEPAAVPAIETANERASSSPNTSPPSDNTDAGGKKRSTRPSGKAK